LIRDAERKKEETSDEDVSSEILQKLKRNLGSKHMEIVKAIGDIGFVVGLTAIAMAPRIVSLLLAMRRRKQ
jgi:hypothetical protein